MDSFNIRKMIMEALGVCALNYAGGWAWIMKVNGKGNLLSVGLSHMLVMSVMVWTGYAISGSHYNPAVTAGLMATGKFGIMEGVFYILAQLVGSFLGAIMLYFIVPNTYLKKANEEGWALGCPKVADGMGIQAFILEMIGTFMYMYMVYALIVDKRAPQHVYGIALGGTIGVAVLSFGTISGGSLNPARVIGPSLLYLNFWSWHIYVLAPIFGAISASFIYNLLLLKTDVKEEDEIELVE